MSRRRARRLSRRRMALLVALTVIPWGMASVGRAPDQATASTAQQVLDQWTETTQVYQNADGTMSATIGAGPIQEPDSSSLTGWSPIDTTLQPTADGLEPEQTDATIQFSSGDEATPLATVGQDATSLSLDWPADIPEPTVAGDTATYSDLLPGVDATLQARPNGFEESFVVASAADAPETIDIPLHLGGITATLTDGGMLVLADDSGSVVGSADPARMWGAATDPITQEPTLQALVATSLLTTDSGPVLELRPDPAFFADPALTYPVTIDPATNLSVGVDTFVNSQTPSSGYPADTMLKSGLEAGVDRSLLSFPDDSLIWSHVQSASLDLWENWSPSCTASTVDLWSVASSFDSTVSWNAQPAVGARYASLSVAKGYGPSCPAGTVTFQSGGDGGTTLTNLVQAWADDPTAMSGFEIRARDETTWQQFKRFNSSDAASHLPVLHVTYDHVPDAPAHLSTTGTNPIVLHGTFSDSDGGSGAVKYTVYNTSGTQVYTGTGPIVASGSDSPLTLPAGTLQTGYTWKAQGFDSYYYSGLGVTQPYPKPALSGSPPWNVVTIMVDDLDTETLDAAVNATGCPGCDPNGGLMHNYWANFLQSGQPAAIFENSFVSYSLCCPSRATFLTGQYAHNTEVKNNSGAYGGCHVFDDTSTIATWLQDAHTPYDTALIGKYLNGYGTFSGSGKCHMLNVPSNPSTGGPQWNEWDSLLYVTGHDASYEANYWINQNGTHEYQDGVGTRPSVYQANKLGGLASDFIAGASEPFFLDLTPSAPHLDLGAAIGAGCDYPQGGKWPWGAIPTIRTAYPHASDGLTFDPVNKVPSYNEDVTSDKPTFLNQDNLDKANDTCEQTLWYDRLDSLKSVDEMIGNVFDSLNSRGILSNTVVIFTSDNGWYNGEHRLHAKIGPYEEGLRVPLAIRYPGLSTGFTFPVHLTDPVLNSDIAPTIADFGGASTPDPATRHGVDGLTLYPRLTFGASWPRERFLTEHWEVDQKQVPPDPAEGLDFYPRFIGIRTFAGPGQANILYMKYDYDDNGSFDDYEFYPNLDQFPAQPGQETTNGCDIHGGTVPCPIPSSDPRYPLDELLSGTTTPNNGLATCSVLTTYMCQALETASDYPPPAYVAIAPTSGAQSLGVTVKLAATGFSPSEQVSVTFTDLGGHHTTITLTADANGKVTGSITIPTSPLPTIGPGTITATGLSSSRTASSVFVVTPG